jgi:RsiW-degrading membrane proteinase PrsW (M82 family)
VLLAIAVAILPVTAFLLVLVLFDSFKLVPTSMLARALAAGAIAAALSLGVNDSIFRLTGASTSVVTHLVAPITEESLKALFILYSLKKRRIGFLVDAAIVGFAVGAGFALVENVDYLLALTQRNVLVWIVRGFGTALLHAATTATIAILTKSMVDRRNGRGLVVAALPGWAAAVLLHAAYNYALVSPVLATAMLLLLLPLVVLVVFGRSEKRTREWVGEGLDLDVELLSLVRSNQFGGTKLGRYLIELRERFPGPVVADMFCLLQLDLELAIRAKGMLMAREAGLDVPVDEGLRAQLSERKYLQHEIGRTGMVALRPLQVTSDRDQWHEYLLEHASRLDRRPR